MNIGIICDSFFAKTHQNIEYSSKTVVPPDFFSVRKLNGTRIVMKLLKAVIVIIVSRNVSLIITEDVDADAGVLNFHDYYSCYFNKYFNISEDEETERREKVKVSSAPVLQLSLYLVVRELLAGVRRGHQPDQPE